MSNYYLSEQSIIESYTIITEEQYSYKTDFFYFLILKHAGLNTHSFITLTDDIVKQKINEATKDLAYLFISEEHYKDKNAKYNFINPFSMNTWGNNPAESIKEWSPVRLINNVTGGGKKWKKLLISDTNDPNTIKLKHDYFNFFDNLIKFPLNAISIWLSKFNEFSRDEPQSVLINNFYKYFNFTGDEKRFFFSAQKNITLSYDTKIINPQIIRNLIGNPNLTSKWLEEVEDIDLVVVNNPSEVINQFGNSSELNNSGIKSIQHYVDLLSKANQALFMGPPGTSKSYVANELGKQFTFMKRIQFHPQYSYQDFIGGKILENGNLVDKKGEFIEFLDKALNDDNNNSYILVIEEINRANVSQVFGELIQLLDRNESLTLSFNNSERIYKLPENLKIVGTMNTTDRTVGRIDFAIKRRFYQVYFGVDYGTLIDKVSVVDNSFSVADLLRKINNNLFESLNNKEMVIGHAIILKDFAKNSDTDKYLWEIVDFANLFNYVLLPIVEDYCNGNAELVSKIVGEKLPNELIGTDFVKAVQELISE